MTTNIDVSDDMPGSYKVIFGSDSHYAVRGFAWETAKRTRDYIKRNKNRYWTGHGDNIDFMNPQDGRFRFRHTLKGQDGADSRSLPVFDRAEEQWLGFIDFFDSIGDRCLEVGVGNHEDRIINVVNVARVIAKEFNCEWGTPMTLLNLGQFKAFLWHPFRFGVNMAAGDPQQRYINECVRIRRAMRYKPGSPECEVSIMSHIHKKRISPPQCSGMPLLTSADGGFKSFYPQPEKITDDSGNQYYHEDHKWFASTGALFGQYVDGDYTYQETRNYDPTELGWIEAEVKNDKFMGLKEVNVK